MQALSKFLVLMVFWVALSGQIDVRAAGDLYLLTCGVLASIFVTFIAMKKGILDEEGQPLHLAYGMIIYFPWLFKEIVLANLDVAYRVWHPRLEIEPRMIRLPLDVQTSLGAVIYANSITLTPGTVTVSVDEDKRELLVHALSDTSAEGLLSGEMQKRIKRVEGSA
jgi:multicomponent Na+:H+ antiporter subunit E